MGTEGAETFVTFLELLDSNLCSHNSKLAPRGFVFRWAGPAISDFKVGHAVELVWDLAIDVCVSCLADFAVTKTLNRDELFEVCKFVPLNLCHPPPQCGGLGVRLRDFVGQGEEQVMSGKEAFVMNWGQLRVFPKMWATNVLEGSGAPVEGVNGIHMVTRLFATIRL
eukprot:s420_g14.t1